MTLDQAIERAEEVAELQEKIAKEWNESWVRKYDVSRCKECAEEHRQLAEWLKELKKLKEQKRWIPVSGKSKDIELVIKISEDTYKATCDGCMLPPDVENVVQGIKNGTPLAIGWLDAYKMAIDIIDKDKKGGDKT